jgi:hypothetical protein
MSRPSSIRTGALILAATSVLGLAACGGGSDTTATSATTAPTGATGASSSTSSTTTGSTDTGGVDISALREQFNQQLEQVLTTREGLSDSQAKCALDELENTISDQDLQDAITAAAQGGSAPQSLIDKAFAAGKDCANK